MPTSAQPPQLYSMVLDIAAGANRPGNFTAPFNISGLPAISVPCGFNKAGLPVGLQLAAKPFD